MFKGRTNHHRAALAALGLWLAFALTGCTALHGPARIDQVSGDASPAGFPGLLPDADGETSYIFQIHGINTTDPSYGEDLLGRMIKYGYSRQTIPGTVDATDNPEAPTRKWNEAIIKPAVLITGLGLTPTPFNHFGVYEKDVFSRPATHNTVYVFTYFWRNDLWKIDDQYLANDIKDRTYCFPAQAVVYSLGWAVLITA